MAVYGIDLGTTYSCLAKFEGGAVSIINNEEGQPTTASAVYFGPDGDVIVGDAAKDYVQTEGYRVVQFVKREIGKPFPPHDIEGRSYNAIEISALILKKIAKFAKEQMETVKDVVITCPAYFGNEERDATKKAGILAGFNVLELINEPTAAAISYAFSNSGGVKDENVVVYDLGGGTFDVTVLGIQVQSNGVPSCRVIATDGDDQLGGKDWDQILFGLIRDKMMEENGLSEISDEDQNSIRAVVEKTKKALTPKESTTCRARIDGASVACEVTREEFEQATAGLLQQTIDCFDRVLNSDAVRGVRIDRILLVGGSSYMPIVKRTIQERYGNGGQIQVLLSDPDAAVAKGAAIYANLLTNSRRGSTGAFCFDDDDDSNRPSIVVQDIASRSFGVGIIDGNFPGNSHLKLDLLIMKGDQIPATVRENYYPAVDNQAAVRFQVYECIVTERGTYIPLGDKDENGNDTSNDPRFGVKRLGQLRLKFPPNVTTTTPLPTEMSVSGAGIHIKVTNSMTGDTEEVDIAFENNQVEMDNNQIEGLIIE